MSTEVKNPQAFPYGMESSNEGRSFYEAGMSLLDFFAANISEAAPQWYIQEYANKKGWHLLGGCYYKDKESSDDVRNAIPMSTYIITVNASYRYDLALAMLAERKSIVEVQGI